MNSPVIVNGVTYNSMDDMPPDVRAQYEAMQNILADQNQNGTPDILENTDTAAPDAVSTTGTASSSASLLNAEGQGMGPIVVLTVVALGLTAILLILIFLLFGRAR